MVDIAELQALAYVAQIVGVAGTITAAFIAVRSYINSNKKSEEAKKKEQETRDRELETRQAQLFMQIYSRIQEPDFLPSWNEIMQTNFKDYQEFKLKIVNDPTKIASLNGIVAFYEGVGVLVYENLIDIRFVAELMCGVTRKFWEKIEPVIEEYEKEIDFRRYSSETRYLYNRLMEYLVTHPELKT